MRSSLAVVGVFFGLGILLAASGSEVPEAYRKLKNPLKPSPQLLQSALPIYDQHCAYCHGDKGKGDGEKMEVKKGRTTPDFTTAEFTKHADQWIMWRISEGVPDTKMNAYKKMLSEKDRWTLVMMLRSFNPKAADAKGKAKS